MAETSAQATKTATSSAASASPPVSTPSVRHKPNPLYKLLKVLASLRITVALFALSIVIVFTGTLAQVDLNIWAVMGKYFRSFYVWIPLQLFFPRTMTVGGGFPFPGGWLLGTLLLINLLAAHAVRFKLTAKRSGIILLHAGVVVLMVSELVTGLFAEENSMPIVVNESTDYVVNLRETELALIGPKNGDKAETIVVPLAQLRQNGAKIQSDLLPVNIEVLNYMVNSEIYKLVGDEFIPATWAGFPDAPAGVSNPATAGLGAKTFIALPAHEANGVTQGKEDSAAAYIRLTDKKTGKDLGTYLVSTMLQDAMLHQDFQQLVNVDGKDYDLRLRLKRTYKPYTFQLLKFTHDVYEGTDTPKNFCSTVRLVDPSQKENRTVEIFMNNPLRYRGETFFQASVLGRDEGTVLQVVRNPGWLMPYIACIMVAVGMLIHFSLHLQGFLKRRLAQ